MSDSHKEEVVKTTNNEISAVSLLSQEIDVFVLTYFVEDGIISSVLTYPECTIRWRLLPHLRGERKFLFSPFEENRGEVVTLYITLVELLMILSLLIALAEYLDNRRDK